MDPASLGASMATAQLDCRGILERSQVEASQARPGGGDRAGGRGEQAERDRKRRASIKAGLKET
jgi:hypothetical protein